MVDNGDDHVSFPPYSLNNEDIHKKTDSNSMSEDGHFRTVPSQINK
jgi:hypothetical protein